MFHFVFSLNPWQAYIIVKLSFQIIMSLSLVTCSSEIQNFSSLLTLSQGSENNDGYHLCLRP